MNGHKEKTLNTVLYIHGKGGSAAEAAHYGSLFPGCEVRGLDCRGRTPWDAGPEIRARLTIMDGGEHWFHTERQTRFLDEWIRSPRQKDECCNLFMADF